ncbi:Clp protease N-terminal domain-containing protein [Actinoplanes sp. NPDC026623]|uniref:Clp protease N-terminal domain-containing protein n=1 Tax=Actinoplanes sp. NPDC026623 TaxID=3155610 RepID=UPI0033F9BB75
MTDQALRALVLAAEAAHTLHDKPVSSYHLLLGLAEAEGGARHVLGLGSARLHDAPADDARPPFATAREVVDRAIEQAPAFGHDRATTADLLCAVLGSQDGPEASLLRASGADPATIRAALAEGDHGDCCQETGISDVRPILAEMGSQANRLPGRGYTVARLAGGLIPHLLLYAAVLAVTWDTSGPELIVAVGAGALLVYLLLSPFPLRRRTRQAVARVPRTLIVPEDIRPLLDRLGLDQLEVRVKPGFARDECYRLGRRAWIVISAHTEEADWSRFILWHEMAHLARRDHTVRWVRACASASLIVAACLSFDLRALAIAGAGTAVLSVATRWWSEAACDRLAVRQAGSEALHAWAAEQREESTRSERACGLLTHPPLALRTALHPDTGQGLRSKNDDLVKTA